MHLTRRRVVSPVLLENTLRVPTGVKLATGALYPYTNGKMGGSDVSKCTSMYCIDAF